MKYLLFSITMAFSPGTKQEVSPVSQSQYFESMEDIDVENEFIEWLRGPSPTPFAEEAFPEL